MKAQIPTNQKGNITNKSFANFLLAQGSSHFNTVEEIISNRIDLQKGIDSLLSSIKLCVPTNDYKYYIHKNDVISHIYKLEEAITDNYYLLESETKNEIDQLKEGLENLKSAIRSNENESFSGMRVQLDDINRNLESFRTLLDKDESINFLLQN